MHTLELYFGWPAGQIWPNLIASAVSVAPAFVWHHRRVMRKLDAHHARVERIAAGCPIEQETEARTT